MGNIYDGTAFRFQDLNFLEQQFYFLLCDRGCRFVHYDDGCIVGDRFHDFQHLNIRCCQHFQLFCRFVRQMFVFQQFFCFLTNFSPFYSAHAIHRQSSQEDIFFNGHFRNIVQFLGDHSNTQGSCYDRVLNFYRLFINEDFTGIGFIDTIDDFHQCGFPCTVFTTQRMNSTFAHGKVNFIQRLNTRERLFDILSPKFYVASHRFLPSANQTNRLLILFVVPAFSERNTHRMDLPFRRGPSASADLYNIFQCPYFY